jgi:hypothetical protein
LQQNLRAIALDAASAPNAASEQPNAKNEQNGQAPGLTERTEMRARAGRNAALPCAATVLSSEAATRNGRWFAKPIAA